MNLLSVKQQLLTPLLTVAGAVDKKQSLAILSNILLKLTEQSLFLTATDLEIEITATIAFSASQATGSITIPAKKMIDIVRSLDDIATPTISFDNGVETIKEGRSRFKLATYLLKITLIAKKRLTKLSFMLIDKH